MKIISLDIYHVIKKNTDKRLHRYIFDDLEGGHKQTRYINALTFDGIDRMVDGTKGVLFTFSEQANKRYIRNRSIFSNDEATYKSIYNELVRYGKAENIKVHWDGKLSEV